MPAHHHDRLDRRSFLRSTVLGGATLATAGVPALTPSSSAANQAASPQPAATPAAGSAAPGQARPDAIIDTHIHVVSAVPDMKPIPEDMERLMAAPVEIKAERLQAEMAQAKVALALAMGRLDSPKEDPLGLEETLAVAKRVPGLRVVGVADPRRTQRAHLRAAERQIDRHRDKIVALKGYLGYLHFGPEDPHFEPYYELAAKYKLPVIFHTGDNWSTKAKLKFAHPLRVDEVAVDHPDVRFVIGHFGNPWLIDTAEVIFKNENVWADLSGLYVGDETSIDELLKQKPLPDLASGVMIGELKKAFGYAERPDRLLYGSDWPLVPMNVYRRFIAAILPEGCHDAVFRTNAEQLFGMKV